jgi:anti-sigma B factor antagonist
MNNLIITQRRSTSVVILDLKGKIKLGEDNIELHKTFRRLVEKGEKNILVNLAGITSIDSSGLGELIAGYITVKNSGGTLKLLHLTKRVRELMVITKLLTVLDCFTTESDAVKSFRHFFGKSEKTGLARAAGYNGL